MIKAPSTLPLGMLSENLASEMKHWNSSSKLVRMETVECHVDDLSCYDDNNDDHDDDDDDDISHSNNHNRSISHF